MITNSVIKAAATTLLADGFTSIFQARHQGRLRTLFYQGRSGTVENDYKALCSYRASVQGTCATYVVSGG